jgi:hypothetical protein
MGGSPAGGLRSRSRITRVSPPGRGLRPPWGQASSLRCCSGGPPAEVDIPEMAFSS